MLKKLAQRLSKRKIEKQQKQEIENKYKELLEYEAEFLKNNDEYDFFGYFMDDGGAPVFITRIESDGKGHSFGSFIYAITPKMLEHCVEHLTYEAKTEQANNIDSFEKKCNHLADVALYQKESWEDSIDALLVYMSQYQTKYTK